MLGWLRLGLHGAVGVGYRDCPLEDASMRRAILILILLAMAACSPPPPLPPAPESAAPTPQAVDPRDPRERAEAVEADVLEQKARQDRALEQQGG